MAVRMSPRLWLHTSRPGLRDGVKFICLVDDRAGTKTHLWLGSTLRTGVLFTLACEPVVVVADSLHTGGDSRWPLCFWLEVQIQPISIDSVQH